MWNEFTAFATRAVFARQNGLSKVIKGHLEDESVFLSFCNKSARNKNENLLINQLSVI